MTAMEEGGFVPGADIRERLLPNSPEPPHYEHLISSCSTTCINSSTPGVRTLQRIGACLILLAAPALHSPAAPAWPRRAHARKAASQYA